jgi:flagellin
MSSILTNSGAMGAIDVLRGIDRNMERTQSRVASGLGVATASDNAAYWSISTTMRSDDRAMSAVEDALALGAATVDTAYIGITNALDVMSEMKAKLVAAREPGIDRAKIDGEIKQLTAQLRSISESSSFNGENWLVTQNGAVEPTRSLVTSFIRNSDNSVRVGAVEYGMDLPDGMSNRLIDESDNVQSGGWHGLLTNNAMPMGFDMTGPLYDVLILAKNSPWDLAEELRVDDSKSTYEIDGMIEYVLEFRAPDGIRQGSARYQHEGRRTSARCRHEPGVGAAQGTPDPTAARSSGPVHRQFQAGDDAVAVQLIIKPRGGRVR